MVQISEVKWIKIATDIFDDEKILLIESMPDKYAIITVWFKLLCLAGKQNNSGVFMMNDKIAYTDKMLATVFRMQESTVAMALNIFQQYGMIDIIEGVITIPNWGKHQNFDQLEKNREYHRNLMRKKRAEQKALACKVGSDCNSDLNSDVTVTTLEEDKNKKENKKENKNNKSAKAPVVYFPDDPELEMELQQFIEMRKAIKAPMTEHAIHLALNNLEKLAPNDRESQLAIIRQSTANSWKGFFPLKQQEQKKGSINWEDL